MAHAVNPRPWYTRLLMLAVLVVGGGLIVILYLGVTR